RGEPRFRAPYTKIVPIILEAPGRRGAGPRAARPPRQEKHVDHRIRACAKTPPPPSLTVRPRRARRPRRPAGPHRAARRARARRPRGPRGPPAPVGGARAVAAGPGRPRRGHPVALGAAQPADAAVRRPPARPLVRGARLAAGGGEEHPDVTVDAVVESGKDD